MREDHVRLGLRHPDLLAQLPVGPALPPRALLGGLGTGARLGDQQRPRLRPVGQRRSGTRRVPQPLESLPREPPPPLGDRRARAVKLSGDLIHRPPLRAGQHDPRSLHLPHLRARRPHDPLKLRALLRVQHDRGCCRRPKPPSSPNRSARTSGHPTGNLLVIANLQEAPLVVLLGTFARKRRGSGAVREGRREPAYSVSTWATEDAAWRFRRPPFAVRRFEEGHYGTKTPCVANSMLSPSVSASESGPPSLTWTPARAQIDRSPSGTA